MGRHAGSRAAGSGVGGVPSPSSCPAASAGLPLQEQRIRASHNIKQLSQRLKEERLKVGHPPPPPPPDAAAAGALSRCSCPGCPSAAQRLARAPRAVLHATPRHGACPPALQVAPPPPASPSASGAGPLTACVLPAAPAGGRPHHQAHQPARAHPHARNGDQEQGVVGARPPRGGGGLSSGWVVLRCSRAWLRGRGGCKGRHVSRDRAHGVG